MNLMPNFTFVDAYSTLCNDMTTLYNYVTAPTSTETQQQVGLSPEDEIEQFFTGEMDQEFFQKRKIYAAASRVLGGVVIVAGVALTAKIILPIITLKFSLAMATAVAIFAGGHDLFVMARNAQQHPSLLRVGTTSFKNYLWTLFADLDPKTYAQITQGTYLARFRNFETINVQENNNNRDN